MQLVRQDHNAEAHLNHVTAPRTLSCLKARSQNRFESLAVRIEHTVWPRGYDFAHLH